MVATRSNPNLALRDVESALSAYEGVDTVAFDLETGGLRPHSDPVHVVSIAAPGRPPAVLHVRGYLPPYFGRLLRGRRLVGHNLTTFDVPFLFKYGFTPDDLEWDDTLVLEQLALTSNRRDVSKSLQATLSRRVGKRISKDVDHSAWGADELTDEQVRYCADDVSHVLPLREQQLARIAEVGANDALQLERAAHKATSWMSVNGVPLDQPGLLQFVEDCQTQAAIVLRQMTRDYGLANPNSHVQVKKVLLDHFGLVLPSTDHTNMVNLQLGGTRAGKFAEQVLLYRQLTKAAMYDGEWFEQFATDGRIYPNYWQLGTETGRMSCSNPNMQQWPAGARSYISAREGYSIVSADLSQVEIVVAAVWYNDPELLAAVKSEDVHTTVTSMIFGIPVDKVDPNGEERRMAKAASFTVLFGGGLPGMRAATLGTHVTDGQLRKAQELFNQRFSVFYGRLRQYERQVQAANARGEAMRIKPKFGPVRSLWGEDLRLQKLTNGVIQGTAASILKRGLVRCVEAGLGPYLCTAIHDEIVLEVPNERVREVREQLHDAMADGAMDVINHAVRVKVKSGRTLEN